MNLQPLERISDALQEIISGRLEEIVADAAEAQSDLIIELNRMQLDAGINANGQRIEPEYARQTVEIKKQKGQRSDVVTLHDTGEWQSRFKVERYKNKLEVVSDDRKEGLLTGKYGEDIQGLTSDHLADVSEAMLPDLQIGVQKFIYDKL